MNGTEAGLCRNSNETVAVPPPELDTALNPLTYPFSPPPTGSTPVEVNEQVRWLRIPMPYALDHVNVYLLKAKKGWLLVDTGPDTPEVRAVWDELFSGALRDEPLIGVLCTHFHVDHIGLAGYLTERWRIPLFMSFREYFALCGWRNDLTEVPWQIAAFYRQAGYPEQLLPNTLKMFNFSAQISPPPPSFSCLEEQSSLSAIDGDWRVIIGQGHSPEPVLLFSGEQGILISGDQLLPGISSNVSVSAVDPEDEPLSRWLASLDRLAGLPDGTLVLPAHGSPFYGARSRVAELRLNHEQRLNRILEVCSIQPASAYELIQVIFKSPLSDFDVLLALGECLAHLRYLQNRGSVAGDMDGSGVMHYRTTPK